MVNHILGSIHSIEQYTSGLTKEEFLSSFLVQDAVTRNIEIIGEASSKISKETKEKHAEIHGVILSPCVTSLFMSISDRTLKLYGMWCNVICHDLKIRYSTSSNH